CARAIVPVGADIPVELPIRDVGQETKVHASILDENRCPRRHASIENGINVDALRAFGVDVWGGDRPVITAEDTPGGTRELLHEHKDWNASVMTLDEIDRQSGEARDRRTERPAS